MVMSTLSQSDLSEPSSSVSTKSSGGTVVSTVLITFCQEQQLMDVSNFRVVKNHGDI